MTDEVKRASRASPEVGAHHHRGKSSESLLDKQRILKVLNIQAGQTILDAGCGNGYMAKVFSKEVAPSGKVVAMDSDPEAIGALRGEARGSNIEAIVGDIAKPIQLPASSLDLLYVSTVMHGLSREQVQDFVREAKRLLKPNGVLAIVEMEKKETAAGPPLKIRFSPEELREAVPMRPLDTVQVGEYLYMQLFRNSPMESE